MTIREILAKVAKGETLTDEEKTFLGSYDPQKDLDAAAAAARKKAEADAAKAAQDAKTAQDALAAAQAKLDDATNQGKTSLQKLQEQVAKLTRDVETANSDKAKLIRKQKVDEVIRATGVQFIPDIDASIMHKELALQLDTIPDDGLTNAELTAPIVKTFLTRNKGVILDNSGHGTGHPAHDPTQAAADAARTIEQMTPEQRKADLKKRGILDK